MNQPLLEFYKTFTDTHDKYVYFLLAAAGAAIGFTTTQTQAAILSLSKIPLDFAVICWGVSFYCGCKTLHQTINSMSQNWDYIEAQVRGVANNSGRQSEKQAPWARYQFRLILVGAVFYLFWHILEMYLRTPGLPHFFG